MFDRVKCTLCDGKGKLDVDANPNCPFCDGKGYEMEMRREKPFPSGKIVVVSTPTFGDKS